MSRNPVVDQVKGLAIIGVVYIHGSFLFCEDSTSRQGISFLSRFAVPIFIMYFILFLEKKYTGIVEYKSLLLSRLKYLLPPFLAWSMVYFLIFADWNSLVENPLKILSRHWSGYGWAGQYFFIIIFQFLFFYPLVRFLYGLLVFRIIISVSALAFYGCLMFFNENMPSLFLKISDRPFLYWIPFAFCALYASRTDLLPRIKLTILAFFVMLIGFLVVPQSFFSPYIRIDILLASCFLFVSLIRAKSVLTGKAALSLEYIGKNSMSVFLINPLVIYGFSVFFQQELRWPGLGGSIYAIAGALAIACICLGLAIFMKRIGLGRLV